MKTKLTILFAALLTLCGCLRDETPFDNRGEKAIKFELDRVPGAHKEPPSGCEIMCDGNGHFMVRIEGKYEFLSDPIYTTRQGAVDRAWKSYVPSRAARPNPADAYDWHLCNDTK